MEAKQYFEKFKSLGAMKIVGFMLFLLVRIAVVIWCVITIRRFLFPMQFSVQNIGNITPIILCSLLLIVAVCPFIPVAVWDFFGSRRILRVGRWFIAGILIAVVVYTGILAGLIRSGETNLPKTKDTTVVLLGCKLYGSTLSPMLANRVQTAYFYLAENPEAECIVSGGQGEGEAVTEASAMKQTLVDMGIEEGRIFEEDNSFSTQENIQKSIEILEREGLSRNMVIITDGYHQYRAQYRARQLGYDATGIPVKTDSYLADTYYVREIFACTEVFLFG